MARNFNGSSDVITLSTTTQVRAAVFGTYAAVVRRSSNTTWDGIFALRTGFDEEYLDLAPSSHATNRALWVSFGSTASAPTIKVDSADGWVLVVATKATGSVPPRFHKYSFDTATWTHENAAGNVANGIDPNTNITIGNVGGDWFHGDIDVVGVWSRAMNDTEVETLSTDLTAWDTATPAGMWVLGEGSTTDRTGNGANQTAISGTTVVDGSPLTNAAVDVTVDVPVATVSVTAPVPTISAPVPTEEHTIYGNDPLSLPTFTDNGGASGTNVVRRSTAVTVRSDDAQIVGVRRYLQTGNPSIGQSITAGVIYPMTSVSEAYTPVEGGSALTVSKTVTGAEGWNDIYFDTPLDISNDTAFWLVAEQPDTRAWYTGSSRTTAEIQALDGSEIYIPAAADLPSPVNARYVWSYEGGEGHQLTVTNAPPYDGMDVIVALPIPPVVDVTVDVPLASVTVSAPVPTVEATGMPWLNHVVYDAPRNGTATNELDPINSTSMTVVEGAPFTATPGNLLVAFATGAVTSTLVAGSSWTLVEGVAASSGSYVWSKVADGTDTLTVEHNGSNFPVGFAVYEFGGSSTILDSASATGSTTPGLTGLTTDPHLVLAIVGNAWNSTGEPTITWQFDGPQTEAWRHYEIVSGTPGYLWSLAYVADSIEPDISIGAGGNISTRVILAIDVDNTPNPTKYVFPPVASVNVSTPEPTVTYTTSVTVDVPVASVITSAPAPTVMTSADVTVSVPLSTVTVISPDSEISATTEADATTPVVTVSAPVPTVSYTRNVSVTVPVANVAVTTPAPEVAVTGNDTVIVPLVGIGVTTPAPTVTVDNPGAVEVDVPLTEITVSVFDPTITAIRNVTVDVPVSTVGVAVLVPSVSTSGPVDLPFVVVGPYLDDDILAMTGPYLN